MSESMGLHTFERIFSRRILDRGWAYFEDGHVKLLRQDGARWTAKVAGSTYYNVEVEVDGDEVDAASCDCPYDREAFCKHVAAVLYAIREQRVVGSERAPGTGCRKGRSRPDVDLEALFDKMEKPDLVSLMMGMLNSNQALKDEMVFRFRDVGDDEVDAAAYARELMVSSLIGASEGEYIDWYHANEAFEGVAKARRLAKESLKKGDVGAFIDISLATLKVMLEFKGSFDSDSYEYVEGAMEEAVESLGKGLKRAGQLGEEERARCFARVFSFAVSLSGGYDSDWCYRILGECAESATDPALRKEMDGFLDARTKALGGKRANDYNCRSERERIENLRERILVVAEGAKAAFSYMSKHLGNEGFRETLFEAALGEGDLQKALRLCRGEDVPGKAPMQLGGNWRVKEHDIYVQLGDEANQRRTARELYLAGYGQGLEYYQELKALTARREWVAERNALLDELESGRGWGATRYLEVLKHEELKPRIMKYCKSHPLSVFSLYSYLLPENEKEVDSLFVGEIVAFARAAYTRKQYGELRGKLDRYSAALGSGRAHMLRDKILAEYPTKPALREELGRR
ncbi:MAG: SWIM zinc finger family protein [Coriobacteriales bacterium]|jgi:hypothetical protein|nr:SWIM zinc finger family protein [Coriobacteriales bacterium]